MIEDKIFFTDTAAHLKTGENDDGVFILGCYKENRMEGVLVFPVEADEAYSFDIPEKWKNGGTCRIKGFLWESDSSMIPIFCKEINICNDYN